MNDLAEFIKNELLCHGADLVGFGDLSAIPPDKRFQMPVGISVAVKYPKDVIEGISDMPTKEYYDQYNNLNENFIRRGCIKNVWICGHRANYRFCGAIRNRLFHYAAA